MLSKTNGKWTTGTSDVVRSSTKVLVRKIRCYHADSKAHKIRESNWLQGRLMNMITGETSSLTH